MSYPVAAVLRNVPLSLHKFKHFLSMAAGLVLLRYVYGIDYMHGVISTTITYIICLVAPRNRVHIYVFIWAMGYMTFSHLYRMTFFYMVDQFDFTRTQMVLTMKLTSFAYNLYDGRCDDDSSINTDVQKSKATDSSSTQSGAARCSIQGSDVTGSSSDSEDTINSSRKVDSSNYVKRTAEARARYAITDLPSPLEFGGYVFCFPNLLAGPAFVYADYIRGINHAEVDSRVAGVTDEQKLCGKDSGRNGTVRQANEHGHEQPSSVLPAMHRLLVGIVSLMIYFAISSQAPITRQYDPTWQATHSFFYRLAFVSVSFLGERFKFYFAWKISEGACIMGGFGCEGTEGSRSESRGEGRKEENVSVLGGRVEGSSAQNSSEKGPESMTYFGTFRRNVIVGWRGVENIDILAFESGTNIQSLSRAWNKRTQNWLEQYVYHRTDRSLIVTYTVSALWHGLYPGFFMFFFAAALMSASERLIRIKVNPLVLTDPRSPLFHSHSAATVRTLYGVIGWAVTSMTLTYHAQTFYMKTFERSIGAFRSFYFIPNIAFVAVYLLLLLAPTPAKYGSSDINKKSA